MDEINLDEIVDKFKNRLLATQEAEKFKSEIVEPLVEEGFKEKFIKKFENITETINQKVGSQVIKTHQEDKNKYIVEGLYHRVYFQKSNTDVIDNKAYTSIIPIYVWKGVTKHLGPISLIINTETREVKWDIPFGSVEKYAGELFQGFAEDKDFSL
jgi:hypothetical protein